MPPHEANLGRDYPVRFSCKKKQDYRETEAVNVTVILTQKLLFTLVFILLLAEISQNSFGTKNLTKFATAYIYRVITLS